MSSPENPPPRGPDPYKSETVTLILSIVLGLLGFNGIGHIYVGKVVVGIAILIGSIVLYYVGIIGLLVASFATLNFGVAIGGVVGLTLAYVGLFAWQIISSRRLCRRYNDYYQQNNRAPW